MSVAFASGAGQVKKVRSRDLIVLVHGLGGNSLWMLPIKWRLVGLGYRCLTWSYASFRKSISTHGRQLREFLETELAAEKRVHFVAHSMGAIVVRAAVASAPPENLGRVVFWASPNSGSAAALAIDRLSRSRFQTISELSSRRDSFVNRLPVWCGRDLGIIAAKFDSVVSLESTFAINQTDHVIVNATHAGVLFSRQAALQTASFLKYGRFRQPLRITYRS